MMNFRFTILDLVRRRRRFEGFAQIFFCAALRIIARNEAIYYSGLLRAIALAMTGGHIKKTCKLWGYTFGLGGIMGGLYHLYFFQRSIS